MTDPRPPFKLYPPLPKKPVGHPPVPTDPKLLADYITKRCKFYANGCALWARYRTKSGYGVLTIEGVIHRVHRVVAELRHGLPLGSIRSMNNKCGHKNCVNPSHWYIAKKYRGKKPLATPVSVSLTPTTPTPKEPQK